MMTAKYVRIAVVGETRCFIFVIKNSKHDASPDLFCVCVFAWTGEGVVYG